MDFGNLVVGFTSDEMDDVDVEVDSNLAYSMVNSYESSSPIHISNTASSKKSVDDVAESCQCPSLLTAFVAHLLSLDLTAPSSVMSSFLKINSHSPKFPCHVWSVKVASL